MPLGRWGDGGMSRFTEKRDDGLADRVTWGLDEIAAMAMFLFSDSANWITGQVFVRRLWFGVPWRSLTCSSACNRFLSVESTELFHPAGRRWRRKPCEGTPAPVPAGGTRPKEYDGSDSGKDLGGAGGVTAGT